MGLFDGFEAGWNSFKNNELKTVSKVALAPNPVIKAITNPQKAIEDPSSLLPSQILGGDKPPIAGGGDGYIPASEWEKVAEDAGNTLLSPNPLISIATDNPKDAIPGGSSAAEKWGNVTTTVEDKVINPVKETVKETVNNVTKGVSDALPIIAIGGAAVLLVSLLLGRR